MRENKRQLGLPSAGAVHLTPEAAVALRIRKDGRIYCAALRPKEPGDTYIDDELHYQLSVVYRVLVSEPMHLHEVTVEWWWRGAVPAGVEIAKQYEFT